MNSRFNHHETARLYSQGLSSTQVAEKIGCSVATVLNVAKFYRINRSQKESHPMRHITLAEKEEIKKYRKRGWSWIRIAYVLKIPAKSMMKQCKGKEYDRITNCERCNATIVNAHKTQKYCGNCAPKVKKENQRFYSEEYRKRLMEEQENDRPNESV